VLLSAQAGQSNQLAISERDAPSTANAGVANLVGASHELNLHSSSIFKAMSHSTASEESSKRRVRSSAKSHVDAQTPTVKYSAPDAPAPVAKEKASGAPLRVELQEVVVERPDEADARIAIPSHTVLATDSMSRSSMRTRIIVPDPLEKGLGTLSGASVLPRSARQLIAEKAAFAIDSGTSNGSQQEGRSSASNVGPDYTTAVVREAAAPSNSLSNSYASILSSFRESPRGDVSRSSSTPSTPRTRNNTTNL
jgi:hypothetical protein